MNYKKIKCCKDCDFCGKEKHCGACSWCEHPQAINILLWHKNDGLHPDCPLNKKVYK